MSNESPDSPVKLTTPSEPQLSYFLRGNEDLLKEASAALKESLGIREKLTVEAGVKEIIDALKERSAKLAGG